MTDFEPLKKLVQRHSVRKHLPLAPHELEKVQAACIAFFKKHPMLSFWDIDFRPGRAPVPSMVYIWTIVIADKEYASAGPYFRINLREGSFQTTYPDM